MSDRTKQKQKTAKTARSKASDLPSDDGGLQEEGALTELQVAALREYTAPFVGYSKDDPDGSVVMFNRSLEPWRAWRVRPILEPMPATPPESGICRRIAYCRGQLDNLPIEALARYTKFFDDAGVSRASLVRYESGDTMPGARELRVLCDALWVPATWLLNGAIGPDGYSPEEVALVDALGRFVRAKVASDFDSLVGGLHKQAEELEIEKRQKWIDQARKPQPRS